MDIFTHAVLPLALLALLRRPMAERLAAGLGGAMPDMDVLLGWATRLCDDPCYAFTHRGLSHALWGAPLFAGLGLFVVTRPWWARRWPRMAAFQLGPMTLAAALLGGLSHVALDGLTITGTPMLWPLSLERFTLNIFFFSMIFAAPVAVWVVWRLFRGTLTDRQLRNGALVLVGLFLVTGALRVATMPAQASGQVVQPSVIEGEWVVAAPLLQSASGSSAPPWQVGWSVETRSPWRGILATTHAGNATPDAGDAIARAHQLGAYKGWAWTNPTPVANASRIADGWRLEFRDAMALHRNATDWSGLDFAHDHPLVIEVQAGRARVVQTAPFFGLGG